MNFRRYQHIGRLSDSSVEGLLKGTCYIMPKIDGTNASVWLGDDGEVHCGSRKRELTEGLDNAGFKEYIMAHPCYKDYLLAHPTHRLYGEWLVPHTIKNYVDEAWRKFYIFDVTKDTGYVDASDGTPIETHLNYDDYFWRLEAHNVPYVIPPLKVIEIPTEEELKEIMNNNTFLMKDGEIGEGIVIKNYNYVNCFNRVQWAKMVRAEFTKKNNRTKARNPVKYGETEIAIVNTFITEALVDKEKAKIELEKGGWESKYIGQLLGTIWHCLIEEEIWNILKKYKNPTINFKQLQNLTYAKVKELKEELFC